MNDMRATGQQLLSTGEVARLLGSSRQHVVDMCTRGELRFVWVGSHRRVSRAQVDEVLVQACDRELTRDQERSLWLHRALLARLTVEPETVLDAGRKNLERLEQQHRARGMTARWLRQWRAVLDEGVDALADILASRSPLAVELRQNSPFAGVLSQEARSQVLSAFVRHWRTEHGRPDTDINADDVPLPQAGA